MRFSCRTAINIGSSNFLVSPKRPSHLPCRGTAWRLCLNSENKSSKREDGVTEIGGESADFVHYQPTSLVKSM